MNFHSVENPATILIFFTLALSINMRACSLTPCCFVTGFPTSTSFINYFKASGCGRQQSGHVLIRSQNLELHAKQKRKNRKRRAKDKSERSRTATTTIPGEGDGATSAAAGRPMATLAGVQEDHSYEQFFYSDESTRRIYQLVTAYDNPLLLCNPSLAVMAEKDDISYLLLDRDKRFQFLKGYKEFSLTEPFLVQFPYDAIFVDPPFANISPEQLVRCIRLMGTKDRLSAPVFIAYNSKREDALLKAFGELPCPQLTKLFRLQYRSVTEDMQDNIYLYGPSTL